MDVEGAKGDETVLMLDLFSGLHGASASFSDNGWEVISIEKNTELPATHHMDILKEKNMIIEMFSDHPIDFIWASPPCYEFSQGWSAPRSIAAREGRLDGYEPDMSVVFATLDIIRQLKPRYWALENVQGACRYFEPYLGQHRIKLGAAYIWGNFPRLGFKEISRGYKKDQDTGSHDKLRSNKRAKVPYWISDQIRISVQYQMMLDDFAQGLPSSRG